MKGKYLYGILDGNLKIRFSSRGLFKKSPYLVHYNGISAIVTDAPVKTYEQDQEGLLSHNRVLDDVIKLHTVLPMRFGTIARSEEEVSELLRNAYSFIRERLSKIRDMVEFNMEIRITDEKALLNEILENNREIKDFRNRLIAEGEKSDIQDKIAIGKMISGEVVKHKAHMLKEIDALLAPYYSKCKLLTGKDTLANLVFLVPRRNIEKFEAAIYKSGEKFADMLKFKYAGPLAPYSFVEMNLVLINFEKVDEARRMLSLGEKATLDDIKAAYRKLAREYHPDAAQGDTSGEEEFKKIAHSYKILYEYCRHYPRNVYIFRPQEINEFSFIEGSS